MPIVGFLAPLPVAILHLGLRYGLDPEKYLPLRQFEGAHVVGIGGLAHGAHFVGLILQGIDPALDERPKEVVAGHALG